MLINISIKTSGAEELPRWVRIQAAVSENPGSISSTHGCLQPSVILVPGGSGSSSGLDEPCSYVLHKLKGRQDTIHQSRSLRCLKDPE